MNERNFGLIGGLRRTDDYSSLEDAWILRQRERKCTIHLAVKWLLENLRLELPGIETGGDLPKTEVSMSVYKRNRSRFYYVNVSFDGLRFRKSSRCERKQDAEKVRMLLLNKLINVSSFSLTPEKEIPTFEEASEKFLEHQKNLKKVSWSRDALSHRDVILHLGKYRLDQITSLMIQNMMDRESKRRVQGGIRLISPRSVNINRIYVHRVFQYAINIQEWIEKNPVSKIRPLAENNLRGRILSPKEEGILLSAFENEQAKLATMFAIETGLRIGEVVSLQWDNFYLDLEIPHFKIRREKSYIETEFPIVSERLTKIVKSLLALRNGSDYLFSNGKGAFSTRHAIGYWFKKTFRKAGLTNLVFHDTRRTFYTRMTFLGCKYLVLEYLMGHKLPGLSPRYFGSRLQDVARELRRIEEEKGRVEKEVPVTHLSHFGKSEQAAVTVENAETVAGQ